MATRKEAACVCARLKGALEWADALAFYVARNGVGKDADYYVCVRMENLSKTEDPPMQYAGGEGGVPIWIKFGLPCGFY